MSYAVRNDGTGWRAVNSPDDVGVNESLSLTQPDPTPIAKNQRVTARAQQVHYATKGHLWDAIENARFRASIKLGITEDQAHTLGLQHNKMYQLAWAAWQDILTIEAEP